MGEAKRRKVAALNALCLCGSQKVGRDCCLTGLYWHKPPSLLRLRQLPQAQVVDRCYMRDLNSCIAPLSGEHLVSRSVLDVFKTDEVVSVSGGPWLEVGTEKIVGLNALRANCLCTKHNSSLAPLDDAAGFIFRTLSTFLRSEGNERRHALASGHDLERWLLKTVKALAVSGNLSKDREKLSGAFSQNLSIIEMLDDPACWPKGSGLYFSMKKDEKFVNHPQFQVMPWMNDKNDILGLQVSIFGVVLFILLEPLDHRKYPQLMDAIYRPSSIDIRYPRSLSRLTLSWQNHCVNDSVQINFEQFALSGAQKPQMKPLF